MHVHGNQINPNAQLDATYAAQKAAARKEVVRTRKKLTEFASELAGEAELEECVVRLGAEEESQEEPKRQNQQGQRGQKKARGGEIEEGDGVISDWA